MWDVWFLGQIEYSTIEHPWIINEMLKELKLPTHCPPNPTTDQVVVSGGGCFAQSLSPLASFFKRVLRGPSIQGLGLLGSSLEQTPSHHVAQRHLVWLSNRGLLFRMVIASVMDSGQSKPEVLIF